MKSKEKIIMSNETRERTPEFGSKEDRVKTQSTSEARKGTQVAFKINKNSQNKQIRKQASNQLVLYHAAM